LSRIVLRLFPFDEHPCHAKLGSHDRLSEL
jgi:hypothetical protein